jgi:hypothetical protein
LLERELLFASLALFDLDDLPAVVPAAARAHVVRALELVAVSAVDEMNLGDEDVAAAIALPMAANTLFRKSTHVFAPYRPL